MKLKETHPLYRDLMAKYILGTERNSRFTFNLLELFFRLKPGALKDAKITNSVPLNGETIYQKGFQMDILVDLPNKEVINIEIYSKYERNSEIKSFMYLTRKFGTNLNVGNDYNLAKKTTQLNFVKNNTMHNNRELISKYLVINDNNLEDKLLPDLFQLYIIDLDQEINKDYNNDELMRWIRLIRAETDEEMQEIVKGNKLLEEVYEEMKKFSQEEWVDDYFNRDRLIRSQHNSEMQEQKEKLTEEFNERDRLLRSQHNSEMQEQKEKLTEEFNERDRLLRSQHNSEMQEQKEKLTEEFNERDRLLRSQHNSEMQEQKEKLTEEFNERDRLLRSQHNSEMQEQKEKLTEEFNEEKERLTEQLTEDFNEQKEKEINTIVENMLKNNISIEDISKMINLPLNKVKDLKKKIEALK